MMVHTLWVWKRDEEGPDLAQAWTEYEWPHGDPEEINRIVGEAVGNYEPLSSLGYRLIDIEIDFDRIERAFWEVPQIKGKIR